MESENLSVLSFPPVGEDGVRDTRVDPFSATDLHRRVVCQLQDEPLPDPNAVAEFLDGARRQIQKHEVEEAAEHSAAFAEELLACREILKLIESDSSSAVLAPRPSLRALESLTIAPADSLSASNVLSRQAVLGDALPAESAVSSDAAAEPTDPLAGQHDARLQAALEAKSRGDFFRAVAEFTAILQADPRNAAALAGRGDTYRQMGEYDRAVADCTASLDIDPQQPDVYSHRGLSYRLLGKVELAIADFSQSIQLDRKNAQAFNQRGDAYEDLKKHDLAVADYSKAIQLDPEYLWAWQNRGKALLASGEHELAIADFSQVLRLDQRFAFAWILRGDAYRAKREAERAIGDYGAALKLDPRNAEAYVNRSEAHLMTNEPEKALVDLDSAARFAPKNAGVFVRRGKVHQQLQQFDKAIADFDEALRLDRSQADVFHSRGAVYRLMGDLPRAFADFDRTLALDPNHAHAWNNRGSVHAARGDYAKAIGDYSEAIRLDPKFVRAYVNRALGYAKTGMVDLVIPDCTQALELDAKLAPAHYFRGSAHASKREYDKAIVDFSAALELDPKYTLAYNDRGLAYARLAKYDEAIEDYSVAIELDPQSPLAWANRGLAFQLSKQHDLALADFSKAAFLDPKYVVAYCAQRGLAFAARGRYENAIVDFTVALRLDPRNANIQKKLDEAVRALAAAGLEGEADSPAQDQQEEQDEVVGTLGDDDVLGADFGGPAEEVTKQTSREETLEDLLEGTPISPATTAAARQSGLLPLSAEVKPAKKTDSKLIEAKDAKPGDSKSDVKVPLKKGLPPREPNGRDAGGKSNSPTASQVWRAGELSLEPIDEQPSLAGVNPALKRGGRPAGNASAPTSPRDDEMQLEPLESAPARPAPPAARESRPKRPTSPTASQMWRADELREELGLAALAGDSPRGSGRPGAVADRRQQSIEDLLFDEPAPKAKGASKDAPAGKQRGDSDVTRAEKDRIDEMEEKAAAGAKRFKGGKSASLTFDPEVIAQAAAEEAKKPAAQATSAPTPAPPPPAPKKAAAGPSFDFNSSTAKWAGMAAAAVLLVVVGSFFFGNSQGEERPPVVAELTMGEVGQAFAKDFKSASRKYSGQLLTIKGTIAEVSTDGAPRVTFKPSEAAGAQIECQLYHPDMLKGLSAEQEVVIVGECDGQRNPTSPVVFVACRILK